MRNSLAANKKRMQKDKLLKGQNKNKNFEHCLKYYEQSARYVISKQVGSVVEWLKRQDSDQHGLGSKPTQAILLCPWERHFMPLSLFGGLGKQF